MSFRRFCCGFLLLSSAAALKTWLPNTNFDNPANWNLGRVPRNCDNLLMPEISDLSFAWKIQPISVSGISLSKTGAVVLRDELVLMFVDRDSCQGQDIKWVRTSPKGWLDPDNWKAETEEEWLTHSEGVPCTGEDVQFPQDASFSVQLPAVQVPVGKIIYRGKEMTELGWRRYLASQDGSDNFLGTLDLTSLTWRAEDCVGQCACIRSAYTVRDWEYLEVPSKVFQEAVCLYAKQRCSNPGCLSPVVPDGHCCGVCGAVIKLNKHYHDVSALKTELKRMRDERKARAHVHVSLISDVIQVVIVAENPADTLNAITLASDFEQRLHLTPITKHYSGLPLSTYLSRGPTASFFLTFFLIALLFASLYYIFVVLPKNKTFRIVPGRQFMFARFVNTEEQLEIGREAATDQAPPINPIPPPPRSFDNPLYSTQKDSVQLEDKESPPEESKQELEVFEELVKENENLTAFTEIEF